MKIEACRFPLPTRLGDLEAGDLFLIYTSKQQRWLCLKADVDYVLIAGSDLPGVNFPCFYDVRKLGGDPYRYDADSFKVAPSAFDAEEWGDPVPVANGSLVIDPSGEPHLAIMPTGVAGTGFASLRTGKTDQYIPEGGVAFASWDLLAIVDGRYRVVLASTLEKGVLLHQG